MNALALLIGVIIIGGMFAKHTSFILMHGSVFEWLRGWITRGTKEATGRKLWAFKKAHELCTCHLCMTCQVSIWTVALPAISILALRYPGMLSHLTGCDMWLVAEIPFFFFAWFVAAIVNASMAMVIWNVTEHLPAVRKEMERHNRANEEAASAMAVEAERQGMLMATTKTTAPAVTFDDFQEMLTAMASTCDNIGCGYSKRECRVRGVENFVLELADHKGFSYGQRTTLQRLFSRAAQTYHQTRWTIQDKLDRTDRAWASIQSELTTL